MARAILIILVATIFNSVEAQQAGIDSVLRLMKKPDNDRVTLDRYAFLAGSYHFLGNDSIARVYLRKAVIIAERNNFKREELVAKFLLIDAFTPAASLSNAIECLRLAESIHDTVGILNTLFRINLIYAGGQEYATSLEYSHRMLDIATAAHDSVWQWNSLYALASANTSLEKGDSALLYAQEAYRQGLALKNFTHAWLFDLHSQYPRQELLAWSLHAVGKAHQALNDDQLALSYFYKGLAGLTSPSNPTVVVFLYASIAESYLKMSQMDSVIKYCRAYIAKDTFAPDVIPVYINLAKAYERKNSDSAVAYYRIATEKRENYFNAKSRAVVVDLTKQEDERRAEMVRVADEEKQARNRNLQLTILGIGLISFCVIYLLISQTIVVKSRLVKFLGVLALLLVFEFINLSLHPVIENVTHHSQVGMFLIMVSIAALLVPAHHKLEKWITSKLVEKNRRIRLEAAKKTIATLEGKG